VCPTPISINGPRQPCSDIKVIIIIILILLVMNAVMSAWLKKSHVILNFLIMAYFKQFEII
jgi:hypothetical protein